MDEQATERMVNAQLKQITILILETIRASDELSDQALLERRDNLRRLVELYASDWETRFTMLTTGFMQATEAIAKFFSDKKLKSPIEALEQVNGKEVD